MSVGQRLRALLDARRASGICWRCSRGLPRHSSGLGQPEFDGQEDGSLFFSTIGSREISQGFEAVPQLKTETTGRSRSSNKPDVPVPKGRPPIRKRIFGSPISYHQVARIPDNAPQFLPSSAIDPRIHFHRIGKITRKESKVLLLTKDKDLEREPKHDIIENERGEWAIQPDRITLEGEHDSSRMQGASAHVEQSSTTQGNTAPPKGGQLTKRLTITPKRTFPQVKILHVHTSNIRKTRVGNTKHCDANYLVRKNSPPKEESCQTPEEEQALHGELESVLNAFRDMVPSRLSSSNESKPSTSILGPKSTESTVEPRIYHGHGIVDPWSIGKLRMPYPKSKLSTQTRHYATATAQPSPADAQIDPPIAKGIPNFDDTSGPGIREHLRLWQEQQNKEAEKMTPASSPLGSSSRGSQNIFTQSGEDDSFTEITEDNDMDEDGHIDLHPDEGVTDIFQNHVYLRRGDLVELSTKSEPILAIFVQNLVSQCQLYTMRGEWVHREVTLVKFAVSRFVHPDDLNDILPYLPANEVVEEKLNRLQPIAVNAPRDAGTKLLEKMAAFNQAADGVFRTHADRLNRAYELIAPWREQAGRTCKSLKEISMTVLQKDAAELTPPMLWAVHRALIAAQNITFDTMNFRQNPRYEIMPQQSLRSITLVREWVREFQENILEDVTASSTADLASLNETRSQNPIAGFVKKARGTIQRSRLTRPLSVNGGIGPSSVKIKPIEPFLKTYKDYLSGHFDENEKLIIRYLDAWVTSRYINAMSNLSSLGPMILRAVGLYDGLELDERIGYTFLQELGVITPWENRTVYKMRSLRLPGHDTVSEETTRLRIKAKLSLGSFAPTDSMEILRKDWGDLPVFCIDSAETLERDDGVSLEPVEGSPSEYWVHIHVANPSAFLAPQSPIGQYAAQLTESVYFPERKYPMLDPSATSLYFSLDSGRPCLTFSARMSTNGDILEKKITPGRVQNVHYFTPNAVGRGLGILASEESETASLLTVGGEIPAMPKDLNPKMGEIPQPSHIDKLRTLADLGAASRRRRLRNGAHAFYSGDYSGATYPQVFLSKNVPRPFQVNSEIMRRFEGDPIITIKRETADSGQVGIIVSDLMVLAGEIAASWCSERGIPIPYRGLLRNPEPSESPEDFKRNIIDPTIVSNGRADLHDLLRYGELIGRTAISATPLEHLVLGLPAYCKATSPLRRYVDLYAHWQIEAALRHEAETGTTLAGSSDDSYLPFARQAVEDYAATALHSDKKIRFAKMAATRHWIVQALHRAFYFKEAPLPEFFKVRATGKTVGFSTGFMTWLNVKCQLPHSEGSMREGGCKRGDVWEARLRLVDPYHVNIQMEMVRLLERDGKKVASMGEGTKE